MFRPQRKRLLLTLAFAAFAHKSAVSAACLSLKDSQGCPGYAHEFISTNATGRFSWYPTNDITAFDRALSEYVNGQANLDEFQAVFRCPGLDELGGFNANHGRSAIRYHRSMICADILNSDENLQECYRGSQNTHARRGVAGDDGGWLLAKVVASSAGERRDSPAPLCRSTCSAWIDSLKAITANTTLCPANSGINRDVSLQSLREKCKWPTYSGASGACVRGDDNEIGTCGYQRVEDWCRYCKYATDYEDTCASVGIYFKSSTNDNKSKSGAPSPTNIHEPNEELVAELEKQSHQEKLYRIAAIILSIAVGVCLIALMVVVAMSGAGGLRLPGLGSAHEKTPLSGARGGDGDGGDGGILGSNTAERVGRATDFVDCFVSAVGKPRQVLRHFFARRDDEISLQQGDVVTLQMAFDDGWVVGKNLTTGCEGTFPLMCVMEALPPSLPAQWSVLPESKRASVDNVRRPSMAATRSSPRSSLPDEISVPVSYDAGPQFAQPRGTQHGRTGSNSQLEGSRLSVNLPNVNLGFDISGNVSRMSNLSLTQQPVITTSKIPQSPAPHLALKPSTDCTETSATVDHQDEAVERNAPRRANTILDRILSAFSPSGLPIFGGTPHSNNAENHHDSSSSGAARLLKRLMSSFNPKEQVDSPEGPKIKHGRPHSFNVNHVVHVGLTTPDYPRPGELHITAPIIPDNAPNYTDSSRRSGQGSIGTGGSSSNNTGGSAGPGFARQPNIGYREFAANEHQRAMESIGNGSTESYLTAEQAAYGAGIGASATRASFTDHL